MIGEIKVKGPFFCKKMVDGFRNLRTQILKAEAAEKDEEIILEPNYLDFWVLKISKLL